MILLDTDHLSIVIDHRNAAHADVVARLAASNDFHAVPVICVEEQCKGWLAQIHRTREVHRHAGPQNCCHRTDARGPAAVGQLA